MLDECDVVVPTNKIAEFLTYTKSLEALSDGPNMVRLDKLEKLLTDVLAIDKIVRG
mgnify:CR=1 FL=1